MTRGLPGEAEEGKGRIAPGILAVAAGKDEMENVRREPDLRWNGRKSSLRKIIYFLFLFLNTFLLIIRHMLSCGVKCH